MAVSGALLLLSTALGAGSVALAARRFRAQSAAERCARLAQPAVYAFPRGESRLIAMGDPHSDPVNTLRALRAAGVVAPASWRWIGGRSILVIIGDVADRGPASLEVFNRLRTLRRDAARAGGVVVRLVGNHEALMLAGDFRYTQPADYAAFGGRGTLRLRSAWTTGGALAEETRCSSVAAQVGTDVFVHGGLLRAHLEGALGDSRAAARARGGPGAAPADAAIRSSAGGSSGGGGAALEALNAMGRDAISLALGDLNGRGAREAIAAGSTATQRRVKRLQRFLGSEGPLWTRLLSRGDEASVACPLLAEALAAVGGGATRMVVGHTVQGDGLITTRCDGRLLLIDTGISTYYGGHASALEVLRDGAATAVYPAHAGGGGAGAAAVRIPLAGPGELRAPAELRAIAAAAAGVEASSELERRERRERRRRARAARRAHGSAAGATPQRGVQL
jgi:hypothetical protein